MATTRHVEAVCRMLALLGADCSMDPFFKTHCESLVLSGDIMSSSDDYHRCAGVGSTTPYFRAHDMSSWSSPHVDGSDSSWSWGRLMLTVLVCYLFLFVVRLVDSCCRFIVAWSLISRVRISNDPSTMSMMHEASSAARLDLLLDRFQVRWQSKSSASSTSSRASAQDEVIPSKDDSCPICLCDFDNQEESVAACKDGCGTCFHRECLRKWLRRSDACPYCRRNMMLSLRPNDSVNKGVMMDLSVFLGYASRSR